jgi:predicted nucleic acid-binding Zn finger protein
VGLAGEQFVDDAQPYCSCRHFHYRVLDGRDETCYHLLAVRMARETGIYDELRLRDDEHYDLLRYLLYDLTRADR